MHSIMAEDKNFNTSCIGRVIHTLMTPGLITKTYMPQTHWQTSILQTLLQLDDLQYKETTEIPQMILIPTSLWLSNTSQHPHQSTVPFASTTLAFRLPYTAQLPNYPNNVLLVLPHLRPFPFFVPC